MIPLNDVNTFLGIMQAVVAPAMIISGLAFLLSIMAGRFARCIDRTRELLDHLDDETGVKISKLKRKAKLYQLRLIYKRCRNLRTMMALASLCVFFVVLSISAIFFGLMFSWHMEEIAAGAFILSLVLLCISMGYFVQDIVISLYGIKVEIIETEKEFEV